MSPCLCSKTSSANGFISEANLTMSLFSDYQPDQHGEEVDCLCLRLARTEDLAALASITAERDSGDGEQARARFERELATPELARTLWIAELAATVVGYARARFLKRPPDGPPNHQPEGWYLGGVVVTPAWRRKGVGRRLTRLRLTELEALGAREVYFGVNATNGASIDMHREFGFEEVTRDFYAPGITFTGGVGILFRADLG